MYNGAANPSFRLNQFCESAFQIAIPTARNQRQRILEDLVLLTETAVNIEVGVCSAPWTDSTPT